MRQQSERAGALPYAGTWIDRAEPQRTDPRWLERALADPAARMLPLWRGRCLLDSERKLLVAPRTAPALPGDPVFLGLRGGPVFAVDLSDMPEDAAVACIGASATADVRAVFASLSAAEASLVAYARAMLHWQRETRFCGRCGAQLAAAGGGHARTCAACGKIHFPRIAPAVIVLIESSADADRCLLVRARGSARHSYSTLAGFVAPGESLEDAVRREVEEEVGLALGALSYRGSQPWPFPDGLMVGFWASALDDEFTVDGVEIEAAAWFSRDEVAARLRLDPASARGFRADSIERALVAGWVEARRAR